MLNGISDMDVKEAYEIYPWVLKQLRHNDLPFNETVMPLVVMRAWIDRVATEANIQGIDTRKVITRRHIQQVYFESYKNYRNSASWYLYFYIVYNPELDLNLDKKCLDEKLLKVLKLDNEIVWYKQQSCGLALISIYFYFQACTTSKNVVKCFVSYFIGYTSRPQRTRHRPMSRGEGWA